NSVTGFGQPTWLATHQAAIQHAEVVERLLDAGASLLGKTVTDELSYSLSGENIHYGTPLNPLDQQRIPGGSSSGSVAAVAGHLVDTALGTDCAGSVRLPASYCGIYGMRPTHGAVSAQGVIPFAPSFDTVGWLARDAVTLQTVGSTLLNSTNTPTGTGRLLIAEDCFALVDSSIRSALQPAVDRLQAHLGKGEQIIVDAQGLERWMECFRVIQGWEIWQNLGPWIAQHQPALGPGIDDRVSAASKVTREEMLAARDTRAELQSLMQSRMQPGDILCLPSSPRIAPLKGTATSTVEVTYRYQAICLLSIAGLCGWPEISLPMARLDGCPVGLSIVGTAGQDRQLMQIASDVAAR
ncbi:MAG: amidase, partial [Gammaproteobacteria bacterium]|nr:amidase [Gammaproteobacteria bacterium]